MSLSNYDFDPATLAELLGFSEDELLAALFTAGEDVAAALASLGIGAAEAALATSEALLLFAAAPPPGTPGRLTRRTARTPAERRAVYRVTYRRRAARRGPGETVRQALGHRRPSSQAPTATIYVERDGVPALLYDVELARRDLGHAARHLSLVGQLLSGHLSPADFRARVSRWRPVTVLGPPEVAGQYRFLSDPDAVIALAELARGEEPEWIHYPNPALRRRRVA